MPLLREKHFKRTYMRKLWYWVLWEEPQPEITEDIIALLRRISTAMLQKKHRLDIMSEKRRRERMKWSSRYGITLHRWLIGARARLLLAKLFAHTHHLMRAYCLIFRNWVHTELRQSLARTSIWIAISMSNARYGENEWGFSIQLVWVPPNCSDVPNFTKFVKNA